MVGGSSGEGIYGQLEATGIWWEVEYSMRSSTYNAAFMEGERLAIALFIDIKKSEQLKTLPCGTPCSCSMAIKSVPPIRVWKVL